MFAHNKNEVNNMDQNTEFLNYIYQNSQMGVNTIKQLIKEVEDPAFKKGLSYQLEEYQIINEEASNQIQKIGQTEKGIPHTAEISTYLSILMKTLMNRSTEHISEMLIQGSTMGIIDVAKNLKKYPNAAEETKKLANKLLKTEQNNIDQLKNFL